MGCVGTCLIQNVVNIIIVVLSAISINSQNIIASLIVFLFMFSNLFICSLCISGIVTDLPSTFSTLNLMV